MKTSECTLSFGTLPGLLWGGAASVSASGTPKESTFVGCDLFNIQSMVVTACSEDSVTSVEHKHYHLAPKICHLTSLLSSVDVTILT